MKNKILVITMLSYLFIISGCDIPDPILYTPQYKDYFPSLKLGETSFWNYYQMANWHSTGSYMIGKISWEVTSIITSESNRVATIQRVFSGYSYKWDVYKSPPLDSVFVPSDTSYFTIKDDGKKIIINTEGRSNKYQYPGEESTFDRLQLDSNGNEISLYAGPFIKVKLRKEYGMTYYEKGFVSMTGIGCTYTRIE